MKLEFFRQIFEKYSNTKFHENPFSGSRVFPYGQTDTYDEAALKNPSMIPHSIPLDSPYFSTIQQSRVTDHLIHISLHYSFHIWCPH